MWIYILIRVFAILKMNSADDKVKGMLFLTKRVFDISLHVGNRYNQNAQMHKLKLFCNIVFPDHSISVKLLSVFNACLCA